MCQKKARKKAQKKHKKAQKSTKKAQKKHKKAHFLVFKKLKNIYLYNKYGKV